MEDSNPEYSLLAELVDYAVITAVSYLIFSFAVRRFRRDKRRRASVFTYEANPNSTKTDDTFFCAVCLEDFTRGVRYRELPPCGHCFHADCIDAWFRVSRSTCPICRSQVPDLDLDLDHVHDQHQQQQQQSSSSVFSYFLSLPRIIVLKMGSPLNDELSTALCESLMGIS